MLHEAKWFGISLALHLAVAYCLIAMTARTAEKVPKTITVVLENFDSPHLPLRKETQLPVRAVVRNPVPASQVGPAPSKPETVIPEQPVHVPQSVLPASSRLESPPEQKRISEKPKPKQEQAVAVSNRPALISSTTMPAMHGTSEDRPSAEKAEQRYLKEHFTYIRDLISRQLVYPLVARKMNWSGKVLVTFTIDEDGSVHAVRVIETSGFPILDKCALETVRKVAPFPRPPVRAEIVLPVNFKMMH